VTVDTAALAEPVREAGRPLRLSDIAPWLWSCGLLVILVFLVLYPVAMLLLGALTNTNPVVDGFGVFDLSLDNFLSVLANPNVHLALANSLIACAGGTRPGGGDRA
jgi:iron(III) transport system permease protein